MVKALEKRKGNVAAASATGIGRGARKSRPMTYALSGMMSEPTAVANFIATAKGMTKLANTARRSGRTK